MGHDARHFGTQGRPIGMPLRDRRPVHKVAAERRGAEEQRCEGGIPPPWRNQRVPTGGDTPAIRARLHWRRPAQWPPRMAASHAWPTPAADRVIAAFFVRTDSIFAGPSWTSSTSRLRCCDDELNPPCGCYLIPSKLASLVSSDGLSTVAPTHVAESSTPVVVSAQTSPRNEQLRIRLRWVLPE